MMRTLLAGLASTALLVACQAPQSEPETRGPMLAFRAANEIGLAQGGTVLATEPGDFAPTGEPILTEDGRFVFARNDGRLAVLDTESGYPRTIEVPVGPWVGTGGGEVAGLGREYRATLRQPDLVGGPERQHRPTGFRLGLRRLARHQQCRRRQTREQSSHHHAVDYPGGGADSRRASRSAGSGAAANPMAESPIPYGMTSVSPCRSAPQE